MEKRIRPLNDRILVRRDPPTEKTNGGIIIPDNAKEPLTIGTVLAVGPGKVMKDGRRVEPSLKVGDRIVFGKYSGSEFEQDGERRIFMTEDEIQGTLEEG
jgi:chaperonin GroES